MRRAGEAPLFSFDFRGRRLQIFDTTVKIVGRAEKEDRASDFIQANIVKE